MKHMIAKLMAAGCVLALSATAASADIACNRAGDCWHTKDHYNFHSDWGVAVHPDNWRWAEHDKYRWHEHEGRGYWRDGVWVEF